MTGLPLIIVFVLAIVVMIVAISKFKVHPFLSPPIFPTTSPLTMT